MDKAKILKIVKRQEFIVAAFSLLVFIFFSLFSDNFYTPTNLRLILQQYAVNGICVLGISIVMALTFLQGQSLPWPGQYPAPW